MLPGLLPVLYKAGGDFAKAEQSWISCHLAEKREPQF